VSSKHISGMPKIPGIESTLIYREDRNLYAEIKAEAESKTSIHKNHGPRTQLSFQMIAQEIDLHL
jgi:hypothetical protein